MPKAMANGPMCCGPGLFTTTAWILCMFVVVSCKFFYRDTDAIPSNPYGTGLWTYEKIDGSGDCTTYGSSASFDTKFNSARAFAVCTATIGFIIMVVLWCAACFPFPAACFKMMGLGLFLCVLFQGLTYLVWKADICTAELLNGVPRCHLGQDGKIGIASACCWFVAMLLCCVVSPPEDSDDAPKEREAPEKEEAPAEKADEEEAQPEKSDD